jgi:hypothetical protein
VVVEKEEEGAAKGEGEVVEEEEDNAGNEAVGMAPAWACENRLIAGEEENEGGEGELAEKLNGADATSGLVTCAALRNGLVSVPPAPEEGRGGVCWVRPMCMLDNGEENGDPSGE